MYKKLLLGSLAITIMVGTSFAQDIASNDGQMTSVDLVNSESSVFGDLALTESSESNTDEVGSSNVCDNLPEGVFCDDFTGSTLDIEKWWYMRNHWGNGKTYKNNGVIPENVIVKNNKAYFGANGDNYSGDLKGVRKANPDLYQDQPGTRVGGCIVSDKYYGSGSYEVRMKLPPKLGVCTALWTFHYQEVYSDDPDYADYMDQGFQPQGSDDMGWYVTPNHEIDIEIPTALKGQNEYTECSYRNARLNTWVGELNYTDEFIDMGFEQNDGKFHDYRFDWHTGGNGEKPRVDFYVDGKFIYSSTKDIPFIKGRFTLGTWFPQWAGGKADFDRIFLEIDWVKITPFNEPNDKTVRETFKNAGMTKCQNAEDNKAGKRHCKLATF